MFFHDLCSAAHATIVNRNSKNLHWNDNYLANPELYTGSPKNNLKIYLNQVLETRGVNP